MYNDVIVTENHLRVVIGRHIACNRSRVRLRCGGDNILIFCYDSYYQFASG